MAGLGLGRPHGDGPLGRTVKPDYCLWGCEGSLVRGAPKVARKPSGRSKYFGDLMIQLTDLTGASDGLICNLIRATDLLTDLID